MNATTAPAATAPNALPHAFPVLWWDRVLPVTLTWRLTLCLIAMLALGFRVTALDTYGLSEDEVNKVTAIEAYRRGDFSANAEHPMLMKLAMWTSVEAAEAWNRRVPAHEAIPLEAALRLPNAIAGAATAVALAGVGLVFFGPSVGLLAGTIWALDPNATAINRLGKEDSFLLLFFLLAVWAYEHGKRVGAIDPARAVRWYTASGAGFGLMLASKYMPHLLGLYALFNVIADRRPGANKPYKPWYYGAMAATFVAANLALLLPNTLRSIGAYVQGRQLLHHGYLFAQRLYVTNVAVSPLGVPVTYYAELLLTKVPLAILAAALLGLTPLARLRHERGGLWLRFLFVTLFVSYSLMAAKFLRYALPLLAFCDLLAALGLAAALERLARMSWPRGHRALVRAALVSVLIGALLPGQITAAPFYSLHRNALGEWLAPPATRFHEETYDYGVREAVQAIAAAAPRDGVIVSDATAVVAHYLARSGRADLRARSLAAEGLPPQARNVWVIVQDAHVYFENADTIAQLRRAGPPWLEIQVRGAQAVQVFHVDH